MDYPPLVINILESLAKDGVSMRILIAIKRKISPIMRLLDTFHQACKILGHIEYDKIEISIKVEVALW